MKSDPILSELRSLRDDLGEINQRLVSLRYEDFKMVFVDQLRSALGEEGRRSFDSDMLDVQRSSSCENRSACIAKTAEIVDGVIGDLEDDDLASAQAKLEGARGMLCGNGSPCCDDACNSAAVGTVERVRVILDIYARLREQLGTGEGGSSRLSQKEESTPEEMENALGPLSNAWRLTILRMLAEQQLSLSEIARRLKMRTGHLQFHVRSLKEAGYISLNRGTRAYSITHRGRRALKGVDQLVSNLES